MGSPDRHDFLANVTALAGAPGLFAATDQASGDEPCHFILVFDNGYFSVFGTFSLTDWLGHVPPALLAKNFGVPAATFEAFPKRNVFMTNG